MQVSDAAAAVYNKIVPSAEAKESSEARQHLNRAGDAAEDAGRDIKTSAHELKEAVADGARGYGRAARDRCCSLLDFFVTALFMYMYIDHLVQWLGVCLQFVPMPLQDCCLKGAHSNIMHYKSALFSRLNLYALQSTPHCCQLHHWACISVSVVSAAA